MAGNSSHKPDARLMLLRIAGKWHNSSSLAVSRDADAYRLLVGFDGIQVTAKAIIKPHPTYFEIRCEGLQGDGCEEVEQWTFANVPVNVRANIGALAEHRLGRWRGGGAGGVGRKNERDGLAPASRYLTPQTWDRRRQRGPDRQSPDGGPGHHPTGRKGTRPALPDAGRPVGQDVAGGPQVLDDHGT